MNPIHSKIGKGKRIHFENLVNWHGKHELILVYFENKMSREVKSTETNNVKDADHCLAKNSQQPGNEYGRAVCS